MMSDNYNLVVVLGPTASGKTRFAALLADRIDGEIISADSRQIYRHMDLGTGKDYDDYRVEDRTIPFHLIDIHEPGYKYNVFEFQKDFADVYSSLVNRKKVPILCGGTGMYIEAVTKSYELVSVPVNEELRQSLKDKSLEELTEIMAGYKHLHNRSDTDTVKRAIRSIEIAEYSQLNPELKVSFPVIRPVYLGIEVDREVRRNRITSRLHKRLKEGMIDEVKNILVRGISPDDLIYYGLEYKYITLYLIGKLSRDEMEKQLNTAIHQFAKRQMTWFRKMEKEGSRIHWLDAASGTEQMLQEALKIVG
jgi:tRNA dimethylallyltransferase